MTVGPGISNTPLPKGFFASGLNCGVRRYRPDLGLIHSQVPAVAAGVYTQNTCSGAHIEYCKKVLPAENIQALVTNSGQANTAMGEQGIQDNQEMANAVASTLGLDSKQVLTASTGVIGVKMEIDKITSAIPRLVEALTNSGQNFANAIMTTDLVPKSASMTVPLSQGDVTLTGIAKGSGMIHPNMATMLGYFLTDLKLSQPMAQDLLAKSVKPSFNMISVDGEPSTNDTVFLLANGKAGVTLENELDQKIFLDALIQVGIVLAKSIAKDGEGATKILEVEVRGVPNEKMAITLARSLTVSPLIKTAIHGRDPNWGRIVGRLGAEGIPAEWFSQLNLSMQGIALLENGVQVLEDLNLLSEQLKTDKVHILIDLKNGDSSATAWGCDMSKKYVEINAEYTT